jgi:hypothetical protein
LATVVRREEIAALPLFAGLEPDLAFVHQYLKNAEQVQAAAPA